MYIFIYMYACMYVYLSSWQISDQVSFISSLSNLMESLDSPVIVAKGLLKLPNLCMVLKEKSPSLSTNLAVRAFGKLPLVFSTKKKSAIPPLLNGPEVLPSLFAENFSGNSNLDESVISLPIFHSRTNLKLHNYALTSVIVLKNCGAELSYMLAELCNECLRQSCFPVLKGITDGPCI